MNWGGGGDQILHHIFFRVWSSHISKMAGTLHAKLILIGDSFLGHQSESVSDLVLGVKIETKLQSRR